MDILLDHDGDMHLSEDGDIVLNESIAQKIRIRLLWFEGEWKWNLEEGLPYMESLLMKNPDIDYFESMIRSKIFEVDEVTNVDDVSIDFDSRTRNAIIRYTAYTDEEVIKEEVNIRCLIME